MDYEQENAITDYNATLSEPFRLHLQTPCLAPELR
jgi:hypothetical protein